MVCLYNACFLRVLNFTIYFCIEMFFDLALCLSTVTLNMRYFQDSFLFWTED